MKISIETIMFVFACLIVAIVALILVLLRRRPEGRTTGHVTHLGPYRNLVLLSDKGGMAKIYRAYNSEQKRESVLKVLRAEFIGDKDAVKKFHAEADILKRIRKEFPTTPVVGVYATGTINTGMGEFPFIEMEYIPGNMDLSDYLKRRGRMDPQDAEKVILQVVRALEITQGFGVIHRDLKPGNILLYNGDPNKVVVCDFGVAKEVDAKSVTMGGYGTAYYMAPEQCTVGGKVSFATDIYALGCIFYELLAGEVLFRDENPLLVMKRHQEENPLPIIEKKIDSMYRSILGRMLAKTPESRPSLNEIISNLSKEAFQVTGYHGVDREVEEPPPRRPRPADSHFARNNILKSLLVLLLVVLAGILVFVGLNSPRDVEVIKQSSQPSQVSKPAEAPAPPASAATSTPAPVAPEPTGPAPAEAPGPPYASGSSKEYYFRGVNYLRKGEYDKAIMEFTKAIELAPNDGVLYFNRANTYYRIKDYDRAISDCNKSIELAPGIYRAYNLRGNIYDGKGEYDKALADYTKAIELAPNDGVLYFNRGNTYMRIGNRSTGVRDYQKAKELGFPVPPHLLQEPPKK